MVNFDHISRFLFSDCEIDFQTARQVNNKLKEPRRLKKDTMAQMSINTFFAKKDKTDTDHEEPLVRVKQEPGIEETSDAETEINFGAEETNGNGIVPKNEPEEYPPSNEATDEEMDIDLELANGMSPTVKVKTEPGLVPKEQLSARSILSRIEADKAKQDAIESAPIGKLDDANRRIVKDEPEEYPPSDEETDEEMEEETVKVKTEPEWAPAQNEKPTVKSIMRRISTDKKIEADAQTVVDAATPSTSKFDQPPVKRKPDIPLEKDNGKKQKVYASPSKETITKVTSGFGNGVRGEETENDAVSDKIYRISSIFEHFFSLHFSPA